MKDRTEEARRVVEKYEGFEFVALKIEDAFDSVWWERVGGKKGFNSRDLGVDLTSEGTLSIQNQIST